MKKVIAIVGPTAVGKTALSIRLAKRINGEVISGDSMQVYRHLDIATAKVTPEEQAGVPHHLINIRNVDQRFSAADFQLLAGNQINEITQRQHVPLVVGGTGFYVSALVNNLPLGGDHFDEQSRQLRQRWEEVAQQAGKRTVWQQLAQKDPVAAQQIPVNNVRRVIRALEVIQTTGQLFSQQPERQPIADFLLIALNTDRHVLYQRINQRVDQMVAAGLVEEARWLYDAGGEKFQSGKGIGYRELFPYFRGECDLATAINQVKLDSRHYAKRQLTWFRNKLPVHWFDLVSGKDSVEDIEDFAREWLTK
ncbi:tRNA (adenosine(37)-N6)-dimethylallyltransferase MiaA [uncultured Limosilactobacillus sp.]|uniref:tRNA (adenosine(37)-N6)-dimethylallyltransferase MiaA n=1 Tax=uncultured Limosilactobacillus sp. TaxID=2837629 RepID=UPI0025ED4888|nr:tRNA (adenosine(37)-N6)-dimethylallyltransferase MiaA [uncultured Limosilactobacillus sp.]